MKTTTLKSFLCVALVAFTGIKSANAQNPVITSFSQNGVLVCSNLAPGSVATVAWASSPNGPWQTNWDSLNAVAVGSGGSIQVSVPMFYRVLGVPPVPAGMVQIPAGWFLMGDLADQFDSWPTGEPTNNIYVSAFYLDKYLVTYALWQQVRSYALQHGYSFNIGSQVNPGVAQGTNHPVVDISWFDATLWCNARSEQSGLTPVYYSDPGFTNIQRTYTGKPYANWSANGYRLPTEAEWEKAARGGLTGQRFPWGNSISLDLAEYIASGSYFWESSYQTEYNFQFTTNGVPYTSPVGSFPPNGYGLYDMAGNVAEMCWDINAGSYSPLPSVYDPTGPTQPDQQRSTRGGSWQNPSTELRCASRGSISRDMWGQDLRTGFRCVRSH